MSDYVSAKIGWRWRAIATCLWIGYFPIAPATACSFVVTVVLWSSGALEGFYLYWIVPLTVLIGVPAASVAEREYGRDGKQIVIDEVAGQTIAFLAVHPSAPVFLAGFLLFRFFDIVKPFPANRSQRLVSGVGVVADDVIAGIYANIALRIIMSLT